MINELTRKLFNSFGRKDAKVKLKGDQFSYYAHNIEILGEYMRFKDKFGKTTLVKMERIDMIQEVTEEEAEAEVP